MGVSELRAIAKKLDPEDRAALLAEIAALESKYSSKIRTKTTKLKQSYVLDKTKRHYDDVRDQYNRYVRELIDEKARVYNLPPEEAYQKLYKGGSVPRIENREASDYKTSALLRRQIKYMLKAMTKAFNSKQFKKAKTNLINAIGTFAPQGSEGDKFRHEILKMSREEWEKLNLEHPEKIAQMWEFYHQSTDGNDGFGGGGPFNDLDFPIITTSKRRIPEVKQKEKVPVADDLPLATGQFEKTDRKAAETNKNTQELPNLFYDTAPDIYYNLNENSLYSPSEFESSETWGQSQAEINITKDQNAIKEIVTDKDETPTPAPLSKRNYYDYTNQVTRPSATFADTLKHAIQTVGTPIGKAAEAIATLGAASKHPDLARDISRSAELIGYKTAAVTKEILHNKTNILKGAALLGLNGALMATVPGFGAVKIVRTGRAIWKLMDGEKVVKTLHSIKALGQIL